MKSQRIVGWVIAAGVLSGCASGPLAGRAQELTKPYPFVVKRQDIVGYTFLAKPGLYVPPESQAVVFPKYKAPVEKVMTSVGDRVGRGQVLIQLNLPSADAAYDQARLDVQAAETAYANAKAQVDAPVRQAQQAVDAARKIERDTRAGTSPTGDATALEQATSQRMAAEQALKEAIAARDANLLSYKQQLDAVRDELAQAKSGVRQGSLRAPISGTVTYLDVRAGQVVGDDAQKALVKIVDLGDIQVKAQVPTDFGAALKEGSTVTVAFKELPDRTFDARVTKIAAIPSGQEITIDFRNDQGLVKEGFTPLWAGVKVGEIKGALVVPNEAIDLDKTGKPTVHVLQGQDWVERVVTPGMSDGKFTEIKSGLKEGETVQVTP